MIPVEKKHARSVPKNMGRSGRYKKHRVLVGVAFVAAARFLGGQRFVLSRTKTIDYWRRESSNPQSNRGLAPSRSPFTFCY